MQIGRIRTINTPRLKKQESKPENQVEIPLSDQSSDSKFRVCQRDSRRNKFEKNEQNPKDSQNKIGAPSAGQQKRSRQQGRGNYPEPGQALEQVPAVKQSVQVTQENKKRRQHSAQDTPDVPQQFHLNSVSKTEERAPRTPPSKTISQNPSRPLRTATELGVTYPVTRR